MVVFIRFQTFQLRFVFLMIHDKLVVAFGGESFKFLTYQPSMVGYWPTMAVTCNTALGFDSGEGA